MQECDGLRGQLCDPAIVVVDELLLDERRESSPIAGRPLDDV